MRASTRKRKRSRQVAAVRGEVDLDGLSKRARYVGSSEHKDAPSFAGTPRPRADASICDRGLTLDQVTEWLRAAILRGAISDLMEGGFPRYVWHKENDTVYEARLTNQGLGEYKGYPLNEHEWPDGLEAVYE